MLSVSLTVRSVGGIDPVQRKVGLFVWQRHKQAHTRSHSQKSKCHKHGEASPDDQLGGGETIILHMSILCPRVPIMVFCSRGHVAVH